MSKLFSLDRKTALIAGASRGIGLAIAKEIAAAGANTILASRSLDKLEAEAQLLRDAGHHASAMAIDIASADSIRAAAASLPDIDILINVTGTNIRKRMETYTEAEYRHILRTNLDGIFELTQLVGARMIARGAGGKVISIGSLTSLIGLPYLAVYAITKGAIGQLTRVLAVEWGKHNIQVNCIAPGFILTDLNRDMWQPEEMHQWMRSGQASPRIGTPEDIAGLAVFLAGRASDYITGQIIAVDGGFSTTSNWPFQPAS